MLKNYFVLFTLFVVTSALSQTYTFDYMLEYNYTNFNDTVAKRPVSYTTYRFINSNDVSNSLQIFETKGTTYIRLILESGKCYHGTILTEDFFVEAISMKCPYTDFLPSGEQRLKDYEFKSKADTIINTEPFHQFVLNPANKKKYENKKIGTEYYILDNSLGLQFPVSQPDGLTYRFWKDGAKVPNGIIKEEYSIDILGNRTSESKLVQILPIKKVIIIDKNCK